MDRLNRMLAAAQGMPGMQQSATGQDTPNLIDNSETVYISSLALLKMLRHGRAGVPMEVMGLMLGEFVDDFTVRVVDVFAMPQSGTGVSVEAVDPVFQTKMMDMLRQTGRSDSSRNLTVFSRLTNPQTRNSSRLVPFPSRLRLLALLRRHQHATILRAAHPPCRRRSRRPHPIRQGQSRHRRLPPHRPPNPHDGPGTSTNNLQPGPPEQTQHSSSDTRLE